MAENVERNEHGTKVLGQERKGDKKRIWYAITLPKCDLDKIHIEMIIRELDPEGYIIARERHEDGSYHLHISLRLKKGNKICYSDIKDHLDDFQITGDIQGCHVAKNWCTYTTKEDMDAIVFGNIPHEYLHIGFRGMQWVRAHEVYADDPWVMKHYQYRNVLMGMHAKYWSDIDDERRKSQHVDVRPIATHPVVVEIVDALTAGKHCYIYGPTGTGKSTLAESYLRMKSKVVEVACGLTLFEFSDIKSTTEFIYMPDIPAKYFESHREKTLRLADRTTVTINPKYGPMRTVFFRGQIVCVSNFPLPNDPALLRRFNIFHVNEEIWEDNVSEDDQETEIDHEKDTIEQVANGEGAIWIRRENEEEEYEQNEDDEEDVSNESLLRFAEENE